MYGQDNNNRNAGYFNSPSQFGSPADDQKKQVRRQMNVVPVTISQILQLTDDGFKIGDTEVHLATFVGLVKSVETSSTKVTYVVQDDTGTVQCNLFLEAALTGDLSHPTVVENTYYRIIGSVRMMQGQPYVMALQISPLSELNELTTHLLEVIHTNVKSKQLLEKREMQVKPLNNPGLSNSLIGVNFDGKGGNSMVTNYGGTGGGMMNGLSPQQQIVYSTIQACVDNCGIHKNELANTLRGRVSTKEIETILEFLSNEGHIYSTIDDEHYKSTESY